MHSVTLQDDPSVDSFFNVVETETLALFEHHRFEIDLLLADSGFFNERVIRRSQEIAASVVHVHKKGGRMEDKLDVHKSYMTTYLTYKNRERELSPTRTVAAVSTVKSFEATSLAA